MTPTGLLAYAVALMASNNKKLRRKYSRIANAARTQALSPARRREIARKAARARWKRHRELLEIA